MSDNARRTIRLKWVRSGIGFSWRQKEMIRSLGLRRLNQVVERQDTPQIRGLVGRIPHLVEVVSESSHAVWPTVPEYTVRHPEASPAPAAPPELSGTVEEDRAGVLPSEVQELVPQGAPEKMEVKPAEEPSLPARPIQPKKPTKLGAARKSKAARASGTRRGKAVRSKVAKPSKKGKK